MNIIEAIKEAQKGKCICRPNDAYGRVYIVKALDLWGAYWDGIKVYISEPEYSGFEAIDVEDILADDWEAVDEYPKELRW